jgi:hypothetical protein
MPNSPARFAKLATMALWIRFLVGRHGSYSGGATNPSALDQFGSLAGLGLGPGQVLSSFSAPQNDDVVVIRSLDPLPPLAQLESDR